MVTPLLRAPQQPRTPPRSNPDKYGMTLFIVSLGSLGFAFLITISVILIDLDVTYFLFEYILPHPYVRTQYDILWSLAIRYVYFQYCALELTRTLVFVADIVLVIMDSCSKISRDLLILCTHNSNMFHRLYIRTTVLFKKAEHLINLMVYLTIPIMYWSFVAMLWVSVKGYGKVNPQMFLWSIFATMCLVVGHAIMLPTLIEMLELVVKMVRRHQRKVRFDRACRVPGTTLEIVKQSKALVPIRIKYGNFYYISTVFFAAYLSNIILETSDLVVIVDVR
ncbi:unnamed protein product [Orchesella dallaii]|uniref:Gustatory receptor n=1 Tax=Orchesella dallaii TaxID=48710 RepID=A0ABP1PIK1_9HEXA